MKNAIETFGMTAALILVALPVVGAPLGDDIRVRPLEPNLWLVESDTDWNGQTVSANGLILASEEAVLLVDTPWTDEQTARLLDWVEEEIGLPTRQLIVTHAHNDRIGGIAEAHGRGITSYAFEGTVALAESRDFEVPQITFEDRLELGFGDQTVILLYPGAGHAPDNSIVWLEERGLLYGGCFIKSLGSRGLGYTGDADLDAWPESLIRLRELVPDEVTVVPGHGEIGGVDLIEHTQTLLEHREETSSR